MICQARPERQTFLCMQMIPFLSKEVRNDPEIRQGLIPEFLKICDWLKANKLSLNILKTEFMIIENTGRFGNLSEILEIRVENKLIKNDDGKMSWRHH